MPARLLLEHLDAPGVAFGDLGADGDRGRGTAFLPFGSFLAPAIWLGWLSEVLLS
jgi:hypothetical protein